MFQTGDKVAHPGHGGCTVMGIRAQAKGAVSVEYLVLAPQNEPEMQIFVPVESVEQVGVRKIISEDTADRILDSFSQMNTGVLWENNFAKRRQAYLEILKKGSLEALAEMINELTHQSKLSSGDKELLPRAQKKLFSEIALAKGMEFQSVLEIAQVRMQPVIEAVI